MIASEESRGLDLESRLEEVAKAIVARKLEAPAIFMLELYKPLVGLSLALSQAASPFFKLFIPGSLSREVLQFLDSRKNIEKLIDLIEKTR